MTSRCLLIRVKDCVHTGILTGNIPIYLFNIVNYLYYNSCSNACWPITAETQHNSQEIDCRKIQLTEKTEHDNVTENFDLESAV